MQQTSIVLISSGQPSANPRLTKEAIALHEQGWDVTVIYCPLSPWADEFDATLMRRYPAIKWTRVGYHPTQQNIKYKLALLRKKIYTSLFKWNSNNGTMAVRALVPFSQELAEAAAKQKAAIYIGHNLGALPAVVKAAKKYKAVAAFDFEDFHRGEDARGSLQSRLATSIEDSYIPFINCATAASPLIAEAYKSLYPSLAVDHIQNCFPLSYAPASLQDIEQSPLKLFWFSQFVGKQRGIETVIAAMGKLKDHRVSLSLMGNLTPALKNYWLHYAAQCGVDTQQLHFLPPCKEDEIAKAAAAHHIGLAIELKDHENRELCLTNKLYMYMLAGNAILYSSTRAQQQFLKTYPGTGLCFEAGNADDLACCLMKYINEPALLQQQRQTSFDTGQTALNWDNEKQTWLSYLQKNIQSEAAGLAK